MTPRFVEAAENLETLLDREVRGSRSLVSTPRSLLRPEDTLPALPTQSVLLVLAAMAHASATCYKETLRILDGELMKEVCLFIPQAVDGSTFYHDHPEDRMRVVTSATGQVLRAKALKMLGQETESLKECIRDPPTSGDLLQNTGHIHRSTSTIQKCQGLSSKS
ncbi:hypothetical protein GWK47_052712 [Chionoecetes opilio]|uniref:Uncharacterized protein n=1 Tax=Chionoecetes opilio TaxID=41210 RepID=A0A8J4Y1H4_CHIOP|nr:hypothetical protein GWK47_052712 [Chionoecetes opilio]